MKRLTNAPNPFDAGECIKKRQAKRAIADYELIGLAERDVVALAHSVAELGKKLLALKGDV